MGSKAGISIVETMIALLILGTIGGALLALNAQIQSASNSANFRSKAEVQAQKMLEQVRDQKNLGGGTAALKQGCWADGTFGPTSICNTINGGTALPSVGPKFWGYVKVTNSGGGSAYVQSVVIWLQKGKRYSTEVDSYLYDY